MSQPSQPLGLHKFHNVFISDNLFQFSVRSYSPSFAFSHRAINPPYNLPLRDMEDVLIILQHCPCFRSIGHNRSNQGLECLDSRVDFRSFILAK
jgi:hypothetical protein